MQFEFSPGKSTKDTIFYCKANAGEVLVAKEGAMFGICGFRIYVFDRVLRAILWWMLMYVKLEKWIAKDR